MSRKMDLRIGCEKRLTIDGSLVEQSNLIRNQLIGLVQGGD